MLHDKVTVIAYVKARRGKEEALKQAVLALCAPTRADNEGLLVFHENWVSKADFDAHLGSPHIKAFFTRADELLAESARITLWKQIG